MRISFLPNYADGTNLDAVLASNDSTALGVENALAANYTGEYPIITGQDCDIANVPNIVDGKQAMSVFKDTRTLASKVVEMVDAIMHGWRSSCKRYRDIRQRHRHHPFITFASRLHVTQLTTTKKCLIDSGYYTEDQIQ